MAVNVAQDRPWSDLQSAGIRIRFCLAMASRIREHRFTESAA